MYHIIFIGDILSNITGAVRADIEIDIKYSIQNIIILFNILSIRQWNARMTTRNWLDVIFSICCSRIFYLSWLGQAYEQNRCEMS